MTTKRSKALGAAIRKAREANDLSIRAVARKAGLAHSYVTRLEGGEFKSVSPDNLTALARILDLPAEDLFALAGYKVPESLPSFSPYLRTRYGTQMPEKALKRLDKAFKDIEKAYGRRDES